MVWYELYCKFKMIHRVWRVLFLVAYCKFDDSSILLYMHLYASVPWGDETRNTESTVNFSGRLYLKICKIDSLCAFWISCLEYWTWFLVLKLFALQIMKCTFFFKAKFLDRLLDIIDISWLRYGSAKVDSN